MCPDLEQVERELAELTARLTPEFMQVSRDGRWSPAQVLEHLMITYSSTARLGRKLLAKDDVRPLPRDLKQRLAQFLLITMGYFPPGRKAPEFTIPQGMDFREVLRQINDSLHEMDEVLASAEARWGRAAVASHPVLGPMSVAQWRKFHRVHSQHHFKQIRAMQQQVAFAAGSA